MVFEKGKIGFLYIYEGIVCPDKSWAFSFRLVDKNNNYNDIWAI